MAYGRWLLQFLFATRMFLRPEQIRQAIKILLVKQARATRDVVGTGNAKVLSVENLHDHLASIGFEIPRRIGQGQHLDEHAQVANAQVATAVADDRAVALDGHTIVEKAGPQGELHILEIVGIELDAQFGIDKCLREPVIDLVGDELRDTGGHTGCTAARARDRGREAPERRCRLQTPL